MPDRSIGLDIGSSAVRAAQVRLGGDRPTLERYAQVALSPGAVRDGEIIDPDEVVEALKRLWKSGNYAGRDVILGYSSQRMFVREMSMPDLPDEDIESALRFEAQEVIPVPMDELAIDFEVLERTSGALADEDSDGEGRVKLLFAAAPLDSINAHIEVVKRAGLFVAGIDLAPFAHVRALKGNRWDDGDVIDTADVIIGLGATMTSIVIAEGRIPQFVRVLPKAGDNVTTAIAIAQKVEHDEAEGLKRRGADDVHDALQDEVRGLTDEIGSSLDYYLAQTDSLPLDRIHLVGGGAVLRGVAEELRRRSGVLAEVAHPLERFSVGDLGLAPEKLLDIEPSMTTALGIALAGGEVPVGERRVSLLPAGAGLERDRKQQQRLVGLSVGALIALLAGLWVFAHSQVQAELKEAKRTEDEAAVVASEVAELKDVADTRNGIQRADRRLEGLLAGDIDWLRLLRQISAMTGAEPRDIGIVSFAGQAGNPSTVSVTATAGSENALANWLARGKVLPSISDLWIPSANRDTATGLFQFSSTANLTPSAVSDRAEKLSSSEGKDE